MNALMRPGFLSLLLLIAGIAAGQSAEEFYDGRNVTILVGSGPGGITDTAARIIGRSIEDRIPGNPTVIVQNMPGGGSVTMINHMYRRAARDGTVFGVSLPGILTAQLMEPRRARYDGREFTWIGSILRTTNTISVLNSTSVRSVDDLRAAEVVIGSTGRGSPLYQFPAITNALLDLNFRIISGYESGAEIALAMERGEVDGQGPSLDYWEITRPQWLQNGNLVHILHIGPPDMVRAPDIPHLSELVDTDQDREMVAFLEIGANLGWPLFGPPDIPAERATAVRNAFAQIVEEQAFADAIHDAMKAQVNPTLADELTDYVNRSLDTPQYVIDEAKRILGLD